MATSEAASSHGAGRNDEEEVRSKPVRERGMSSITKLLIQGIRGFGSGDDQKAVIEFGKPLTLITGQNGAGKTTVIECLKYATTGDLPPNSKGGAFVHDPKLVNERAVKGCVKLKFQDITGTTIVCHRLLQSTQKPRKIEQKTLDSSLEKILPGGERAKITTRCAEIDREMVDRLGVSKAILNHVIFCHQEESAWPLSEGKALKAKFDDIFASTRYTKALENFKKIQQGLTGEIRIYKVELQHLKKQKEKLDEVRGDLQDTQKKVENSKADITRIKNELVPMENRYQELTGKYDELSKIEKEITMYETSRQELLRSQRQLQAQIEEVFTGTKVQLQLECEQHHSVVERNTAEQEQVERKLRQLVRSVEEMKKGLDECHKEHGRLKTEEEYHKERIASRNKNLTAMATKLALPGFQKGPFDQARVTKFLTKFMQHRKQAEEKAKDEKQKFREKEQEMQKQLDDLRTNLARIEESIQMKNATMKENRRKVAEITKELTSIGSGGAALEGVEQELAGADKELTEYRDQVDLISMEEELGKYSEEKQKLNTKVQQLQKEMSQLSVQSGARGALEELRKQKRSRDENYQLEQELLQPDLLSVLGVMPSSEENLSKHLRDLEKSREKERETASNGYRQAEAKMSRLQAQREELEKQLEEKRNRVEALQQEVSEVCGEDNPSSYQELVESLQAQVDSASENIATVKGSQSFFRKSLEKIHSNHKCPLCMRGFEEKSSLDSTIKLITTRLNDAIPRMIPRLNTELHQLQEKQKRLQELKPKIEELSLIRSQGLPERQAALEEKKVTITDIQASITKEKEKQAKLQKELEKIRTLQPKVSKVVQLKEQLSELDEKIGVEESKLGRLKMGSQRSQHLVNRECQEAQRGVEELNRKMDNKRQEMSDTQRTLRQLEDRVHRLREEKLQLQSQLQKRESLISKKNDLNLQVKTLEREVKSESTRTEPVKEKMEQLGDKKAELIHERGEAEKKSWAELEDLRLAYDGLKKTSETINRYILQGKDKTLEECEERMEQLTTQMTTKNADKKELEEKITILTKQLANAKNRERDLTDNLQLLTQQEEIERKEKKVKDLKDTLRKMGLDAYEDEYQRLQADVDRLRKEQARAEGHKLGVEDQVRHLQKELQSEMYSGLEDRYMDMVIKLKTTEKASGDLHKYYRALDRAIMKFHSRKMEEINQIIKELWIKTYKGGDIDTVKIMSDDTTHTDAASITSRRVFNYRLVMVKGSTELDMRGRCSAGQKVLASIIIRLALAETFCLTSGLLALDEPTTNLDRDNVEGLAMALTDIVKERSKNQKNFQLIIITHDEAFVELLGHTGYTDCFYKVTKNFGETSKIGRYYF